ncbi:MAG: hypothetical protein OIF40_14955 [Mangrovicoccus sp.]|nr:hypothetical protein [Mangrovicoccus sp.]
MTRILFASLFAGLLAACSTPGVHSSGSIHQNGDASANVGVNAGPVHAGVGTSGAHGSVDVVETDRVSAGVGTGGAHARADVVKAGPVDVDARIGTHGASASVGVGNGIRVGFGRNGWRLGW